MAERKPVVARLEAGEVGGGRTCRVSWVIQGLNFIPRKARSLNLFLHIGRDPHWAESHTPYTHIHTPWRQSSPMSYRDPALKELQRSRSWKIPWGVTMRTQPSEELDQSCHRVIYGHFSGISEDKQLVEKAFYSRIT